ncbi:hypothetical protein Tco_1092615 [Tanacetum coccineum]|uniref:Zinc finger, CCHC-type n=1 Tax=Tanacetum coccineum TaxID=301880 RepID=A0ABQ5IAD5_9ASTR
MNTRLNIEKLDGNIVQKHGGSKQVGFKQLGPGVEIGVHGVNDEKRVWFEVELQGAQRDHEVEFGLSKVLWVEDTTMFTYLVNRSPSSAIGFKTPIDMLGFFGWLAIKQGMLEPVKVKCIFLGYSKGFNESREYKKTFIGSGVGTGSMQVLQGDKFEYREDSNEAAFVVAAVEKIYAHESLTFNNTVACEVISKWKVGLKDDMDARTDVIHNEKLVQTWLKGHSILSGDCDVDKNGKWSCIYAVGSQEYQMVCTRLDITSADVGLLDKFDHRLQIDVQVFVDFDYTMGRPITSGVDDTYGGYKGGYLTKETRNRVRIQAKDSSGYCYRCLVKGYP